jgi:hypothetical protein
MELLIVAAALGFLFAGWVIGTFFGDTDLGPYDLDPTTTKDTSHE